MSLGLYALIAQVGSGPDGVSYRARGPTGDIVLLHDLSRACADPVRWPSVRKRLQTAALIDHAAILRLETLHLDAERPYVVQEWCEARPLADVQTTRRWSELDVIRISLAIAEALAECHRLGLAHGRLHPRVILVDEDGNPRLDPGGLDLLAAEADATRIAPSLFGAASEDDGTERPSAPTDIRRLGEILRGLFAGRAAGASGAPPALPFGVFQGLLSQMCAEDASERPSAFEVFERLRAFYESLNRSVATIDSGSSLTVHLGLAGLAAASSAPSLVAARVFDPATRRQLGRYRLLESLGQGGMGAVYRAEDASDGTVVAIKVLRPEWASRTVSLRRFQKEARLLAEVQNPFVTNLLEVNEDEGIHYLVLEFVAGMSLGALLAERGSLDEPLALSIAADVARALTDAHERGIVHRDIKPDNILLTAAPDSRGRKGPGEVFRVKLSDFGLARHVIESESLQMTQAGIVGTPHYMAPEQCSGSAVDARTDVYSLGATLYHLLAGRSPFHGAPLTDLLHLHRVTTPPPLTRFNAKVSEAACRIVERALAKVPGDRYADASAMLADLERVLRGEPSLVASHPQLPGSNSRAVLSFDFEWDLESTPRELWPHVSNTERLNRAVGLPAVAFSTDATAGGRVRRFARAKIGGLQAEWEEHPFEWVEPRRFGVLREYRRGPFKWFVSIVELTPHPDGGTRLTHRVRLEPRNGLLRPFIAKKVGRESRQALDRIYRRIDASIAGKLGRGGAADPFERPEPLAPDGRRKLEQLLDRLTARGLPPAVLEGLGEFITHAPAQEVARIRPLALARRLGLDGDDVVAACLHGAREGLLRLLWDLLCPVCRIPSEVVDTLRDVREHGHCDACNLDYELDFANSVEMIFRVHPEIRETELGVYCIGGPAHSPHVVAQVRVAPGERLQLELDLPEGQYQVRGPQLPASLEVRVEPEAALRRLEISLARLEPAPSPFVLRAGRQSLSILNDHDQELVVRIERAVARLDALTAARASTMALFRELFPNEVLATGRLFNVTNVALLVTALDRSDRIYHELGDARAFAIVHEHFQRVDDVVRREGGALLKTVAEGTFAAFADAAAAVRAALALQGELANGARTQSLRIRAAVHRGPAMAATLNDRLDYFGATVHDAVRLLSHASASEVLVSQSVASDVHVAALLVREGIVAELAGVEPADEGEKILVHRLAR